MSVLIREYGDAQTDYCGRAPHSNQCQQQYGGQNFQDEFLFSRNLRPFLPESLRGHANNYCVGQITFEFRLRRPRHLKENPPSTGQAGKLMLMVEYQRLSP